MHPSQESSRFHEALDPLVPPQSFSSSVNIRLHLQFPALQMISLATLSDPPDCLTFTPSKTSVLPNAEAQIPEKPLGYQWVQPRHRRAAAFTIYLYFPRSLSPRKPTAWRLVLASRNTRSRHVSGRGRGSRHSFRARDWPPSLSLCVVTRKRRKRKNFDFPIRQPPLPIYACLLRHSNFIQRVGIAT